MKNKLITAFEERQFAKRKIHPEFRSGDTVRIMYKIQEGADKTKFRLQLFEGVVVSNKRGTVGASFTVRKIGANGIGVERIFPLYSPYVDSIDVIASGIVRRAKLFYLRDLSGKAARIRSRFLGRRAIVIPGQAQADAEAAAEASKDSGAPQA